MNGITVEYYQGAYGPTIESIDDALVELAFLEA
jgi:hypothetical protein